MNRPRIALAGLAAAALLFTACGGGDKASDNAPPSDADLVVKAVTGNKLDAASYTAKAGSVKLAYIGEPTTNHTLIVTTPDGTTVGTKMKIQPGKSAEETFTLEAGTYKLLCDVPGHDNMKADLVVS